jgi:hypothetical protein
MRWSTGKEERMTLLLGRWRHIGREEAWDGSAAERYGAGGSVRVPIWKAIVDAMGSGGSCGNGLAGDRLQRFAGEADPATASTGGAHDDVPGGYRA